MERKIIKNQEGLEILLTKSSLPLQKFHSHLHFNMVLFLYLQHLVSSNGFAKADHYLSSLT